VIPDGRPDRCISIAAASYSLRIVAAPLPKPKNIETPFQLSLPVALENFGVERQKIQLPSKIFRCFAKNI
jgi:hypothetical protein